MEASTSHSGPACFGCSPPHAVYHFSIVTIWYLANVATVAALYRPFGSKESAAERAREKEDMKGKEGYGEGEGSKVRACDHERVRTESHNDRAEWPCEEMRYCARVEHDPSYSGKRNLRVILLFHTLMSERRIKVMLNTDRPVRFAPWKANGTVSHEKYGRA